MKSHSIPSMDGWFPADEAEALGLISMASTVAALSKATK